MLGKKSVEQINAKISSIIGADMVVDGSIHAKEAVRVEGTVNGDVETDGALIIRTEVASTGKVIGNIRTKSLVVDENAVFQGQCIMNAEGLASLPESPVNASEPEKTEEKDQEEQKKDNNKNKR